LLPSLTCRWMEVVILSHLKFELLAPTAAFFLAHLVQQAESTGEPLWAPLRWPNWLARSLVEGALCEYRLAQAPPSQLAQAVYFAISDRIYGDERLQHKRAARLLDGNKAEKGGKCGEDEEEAMVGVEEGANVGGEELNEEALIDEYLHHVATTLLSSGNCDIVPATCRKCGDSSCNSQRCVKISRRRRAPSVESCRRSSRAAMEITPATSPLRQMRSDHCRGSV